MFSGKEVRMMYEIKLAEKDKAVAIVDLLNKVTLNLHRKGINQWTYPWDSKEIEMDIKSGRTNIIIVDDSIAGTFSLKVIEDNSWFSFIKSNSIYLYRIAILPAYQGKNLGIEIINYACKIARNSKKHYTWIVGPAIKNCAAFI